MNHEAEVPVSGGIPSDVWRDGRVVRGMSRQLDALRKAGSSVSGWKLGLGTRAAKSAAGTSGALVGYLTTSTLIEDGARIDLSGWTKAAVEPEIAIIMGRDLSPGSSRAQAAEAVRGLALAYELVDLHLPLDRVEDILAGGIFHRHYLLGDMSARRSGADVNGLSIEVGQNGDKVTSSDDVEASVGNLLDLTIHTADYLGEFGYALSAGHCLISGSVVPPVIVEPGDGVTYEADGLGSLKLSFV